MERGPSYVLFQMEAPSSQAEVKGKQTEALSYEEASNPESCFTWSWKLWGCGIWVRASLNRLQPDGSVTWFEHWVFFFSLHFLKNIYNLFFFFFQFYTHKFTEKPHQLSVSVILAGGFTVYKEDIIQRKLSQRRSYQQGSLNLKDHCQVSFIKITNHLEALSYQLTMTCEINEQSLASAQCD